MCARGACHLAHQKAGCEVPGSSGSPRVPFKQTHRGFRSWNLIVVPLTDSRCLQNREKLSSEKMEQPMKRMKSGLLILLSGLLSLSLLAADFWDKKPYTEWKAKECEKLLEKSPWSYPYAISRVTVPGHMTPSGGTTPTRSFGDADLAGATGDREVISYLQVRFVSARPVKAAIGRMRLLANADNQALDEEVNQYVNQPESGEIIIEITYYSEPPGHPSLRQIENFLRTVTAPQLKDRVFLSDSEKNTHVSISRYQGPTEGYPGALLFFPRQDEAGEPHFNGSEKRILFHMEMGFAEVDLKLKPRDMIFEGKFAM